MVQEIISRMSKRMTFTTGRRLMWSAGLLPSNGWKSTLEKYEGRSEEEAAGRLLDSLAEHSLYNDKHIKLHPMNTKMRVALQDKLISLELPDSPARDAYPMCVSDEDLAKANGKFTPVAIEKSPDGVGVVFSQVILQKTRETIDISELDNSADLSMRYDELVGVKLQPMPLFHVLWVPHERDCVEFRLDCTMGVGTRNAFQMHSNLRRTCEDMFGVRFEEACELFPAIVSLYSDTDIGRATEISFSTASNGIHNERLAKKDSGDSRTQAYHIAGKKGVDDDISVYQICVEWSKQMGTKSLYPISVALSGTGPSGNGPGGTPQVKAAMLMGCLYAADYEQLIEVLTDHASLEDQ